jgi:hypothetical protein
LSRDEQSALPGMFSAANFAEIRRSFLVDERSSFARQIETLHGDTCRVGIAGRDDIFQQAIKQIRTWTAASVENSLLWIQLCGPQFVPEAGEPAPDTVSKYTRQAEECDGSLEALLGAIEAVDAAAQPLLIITAAEGECVLTANDTAYQEQVFPEERVHCPLMLSVPDLGQAGSRRQVFTQSVDIAPTVADWFEVDISTQRLDGLSLLPLLDGSARSIRRRAFWGAGRAQAVRNENFYLLRGDSERSRLFLKPEDRYERADVAAQYADAVEELEADLDEFLRGR